MRHRPSPFRDHSGSSRVQVETPSPALAVVSLVGEHDLADCESLKQALDLAASRRRHLIVDLSDCAFIDSTVISLLLYAKGEIVSDGGRFGIVIPVGEGPVARVARIMQLDALFPLFPSFEDALAAVSGPRGEARPPRSGGAAGRLLEDEGAAAVRRRLGAGFSCRRDEHRRGEHTWRLRWRRAPPHARRRAPRASPGDAYTGPAKARRTGEECRGAGVRRGARRSVRGAFARDLTRAAAALAALDDAADVRAGARGLPPVCAAASAFARFSARGPPRGSPRHPQEHSTQYSSGSPKRARRSRMRTR